MRVVPYWLALPNHARLASCEGSLDQEGDLDGVSIGQPVLEQWPGSHAKDYRWGDDESTDKA